MLELSHEKRFETILYSVNTEFKSITLGFCLDESWRPARELGDIFKEYTEVSGVAAPSNWSFAQYCRHAFVPRGLVEERKEEKGFDFGGFGFREPTIFWRLTNDGTGYGKPSAAFAIKTANELDTSLYTVLGYSPHARAKILMELYEVDWLRERDLLKKILSREAQLSGTRLYRHCVDLAKTGFIEYESKSAEEEGWSLYRWMGELLKDVKPVGEMPTLTLGVAKFLREHPGDWNRHEIAEKMGYTGQGCIKLISHVLSGLQKQGFVKSVKFKGRSKQSEARIIDKGKTFVEQFLYPLYNALDPDANVGYLEEFEKPLESYLSNPGLLQNHIIHAVELYSLVSPHQETKSKKDIQFQIIDLLGKEGSLRHRDIKSKMRRKHLYSYLNPLVNQDILRKERKGSAVYYSLVDNKSKRS